MSLSPQWHSTLFGWWWFATCFWSAICRDVVFAARISRRLLGADAMSSTIRTVLHDFGKLVFAFSIFWIYLSFAQYLVIWYGDHSDGDFLSRRSALALIPGSRSAWLAPILIWVVPFFVLMGVRPKKTPRSWRTVALLGLIGVWDLDYIMVVPSLSPDNLPLGWVELCITAGFLGTVSSCARFRA